MTKIKLLKYLLVLCLLFPSLSFAKTEQFGNKQIFIDFDGLPFALNNLTPGKSETKEIIINNKEGFDVSVYLGANKISENKNLASVLLLSIAKNQPISLLELFKEDIFIINVPSNSNKNISLEIIFPLNSGNEYQASSLDSDFKISVTQISDTPQTFGSVVLPGIYNGSPVKEDPPISPPENPSLSSSSSPLSPSYPLYPSYPLSPSPVSPISPVYPISPIPPVSPISPISPISPVSPASPAPSLPLQSNLLSLLPVILKGVKNLVDNGNSFLIFLFFLLLLVLLLIKRKRKDQE